MKHLRKHSVILFCAFLFSLTLSAGVASAFSTGSLAKNKVCMVNDRYMGVEQYPVDVNGKTYFGCCEDCVSKLQNNHFIRVSVDPVSGKVVDKVDSFIALDPAKKYGEVLYFESEANYRQFVEN